MNLDFTTLSVMTCMGGETPPTQMVASSFEAGSSSSRFGVATTLSSFSFPFVHYASAPPFLAWKHWQLPTLDPYSCLTSYLSYIC